MCVSVTLRGLLHAAVFYSTSLVLSYSERTSSFHIKTWTDHCLELHDLWLNAEIPVNYIDPLKLESYFPSTVVHGYTSREIYSANNAYVLLLSVMMKYV